MASIRRLIRPLLSASALALLAVASAQAFQWRDVVQKVDVRADGSVVVDDTRTLWTNGDFGEAFVCVHLSSQQTITLLEGSGAVDAGPRATAFQQGCDGGTELVVRNETRVQERRVRFLYRIDGALDVRRDVVQWYWQILETDHPDVRGYSLTVTAPGPMSAPYDAYVHRFGNQEKPTVVLSSDRSRLQVELDRVPDPFGVEVRYLMDPALFDAKGSRDGLQEFLLDESRVAGVQTWELVKRSPWWAVLPASLLSLVGIGALGAYRRVGREPRIESMKYPFEPPSDLPPAAVTALMHQSGSSAAMGPAFHATIMDLVRRGYGEFEAGRKASDFAILLKRDKDESVLQPFERQVLGYLKSAAAGKDPDRLTTAELKRYSERNGATFRTKWGTDVRKWLEQQRGGELTTAESRQAARKWARRFGLVGLASLVLVFLLAGVPNAVAIAATAASFVGALVAGLALPSWRPDVASEVYGWQGFKRTLTDYTRMKDAPLDFFKLWDVYYCYAAALGVADRYLSTLKRAAPLANVDEQTLTSRATWMGAGSATSLSSFSAMSRSISSLSSALSSAGASASSGGSSSGGGGGGGGGSSGGR